MDDLDTRFKEFFYAYENANAEFDVQRIAACYADTFMFGGPAGVQPVKKEDFVRVLPRRKEYFKSLGLVSSRLERLEASTLDSRYALVKVVWRMRFERSGAEPIESDNSATYVLSLTDNRLEILFQIDHQDLAKKAEELRL